MLPAALSGSLLSSVRGASVSHSVLDQADDGCEDRARNAAADGLPNQCTDIDIARGALQQRQQARQQRSTAGPADRAGKRIAERAEVEVLHRGAGGVAAERTGDK